jgi:hypothetical protein
MVYIRIIFLSLLAGAAAAGFVWYAWGVFANVGAYRKFKSNSVTDEVATEDTGENGG